MRSTARSRSPGRGSASPESSLTAPALLRRRAWRAGRIRPCSNPLAACSSRSVVPTLSRRCAFSRRIRSISCSRAASAVGFEGRPPSFGVMDSINAPIARCRIVWKWLRDMPSVRAACATLDRPAITSSRVVKRCTSCGGTAGAGV
jgi:hypothetical protein